MVNYSNKVIIVRGTDLSKKKLIIVNKMSVFVSRPMKLVACPRKKTVRPQNELSIFFGKKTQSETKQRNRVDFFSKKDTTTTTNP